MKNRTVTIVAAAGLMLAAAVAYFANRPVSGPTVVGAMTTVQTNGADPTIKTGDAVKSAKGDPVAAVPVEVVKVVASVVQEDLVAVGSLRSNESVVLRPEVAGRIAKIGFRDGQPVKGGQLLLALDASVNEAEVAQARAEFELAQSNLKRTEDLAHKNFVSSSAQDQAASNAAVQEAKLKLAEARLSKMQIVAPFDGVVGIRSVSVGDYVKDGTDIVNIEDISTLKVDFRLPERLFSQLRTGQRVEVVADALPNETFAGTVDAINPRIDANGRSLEVRAKLANRGTRLRPGMFVRVRVIVGERGDALVVPEQAIVPSGDEFFAYRVVDGKAQRVQVKTGVRRNGTVEVLQGLAAGDMVVVSGQQRLTRDGQAVRVTRSDVEGGPGPTASDGKRAPAAAPARSAKG